MQNQQNLPAYLNDNHESETSSPVKKSFENRNSNSFKSPLTSGKKSTLFYLPILTHIQGRNMMNNENIEPEQHNPFSGPVYAPNPTLAKAKSSPIPLTPIKIKEERDHNMGLRQYESPFSIFCKDLKMSPARHSLMSPSPVHPSLQYNYRY